MPFAVDLPPTTFARGKLMPSNIQKLRFSKRANAADFYKNYNKYASVKLPRKAPVPGYTGYFVGMNCDYGVSKAFGLPMELMQIPKTPQGFHEEMQNGLQSGYGPGGKHRMG